MPLRSPVTVQLVSASEVVVQVLATPSTAGAAVTVYRVIAAPPFDGALQLIVAETLPAIASVIVGMPGTDLGVTGDDSPLGWLVPWSLVAVTVKR